MSSSLQSQGVPSPGFEPMACTVTDYVLLNVSRLWKKILLPVCRHMDTKRIHNGMTIYFALENIGKK
jgi:hypothetical protein